ncbi:MAG: NAD(P)H-dependent oxidoreductase subunit E, partial [Bacteroidota bacterium]
MGKTKVIVGLGSCGIAAGANKTYQKIESLKKSQNLDFELKQTSCIGMCYNEPLVEIIDDDGHYLYGNINEDRALEILEKHVRDKEPLKDYVVHSDLFESVDDDFFDDQVKIALRNCGYIDPESIEEAENKGAYEAMNKIASENLDQDKIIKTVLDSGLRGRGGGGFPTGKKWMFAKGAPGNEKYIICNADEGDPGAFMDRSLLEGDPHAVLEGMIIGGFAVNANQGVIYCRAEYPLAIKRLNIAIQQAREKGYLGKDACGIKGFNFDIYVKEGAGAFVCGEETALMASIEGERGMPRKR